MKILTLVFFATLPLLSYAQDLPVYPALSAKNGAELFSMARISKFRVLVFPHWGVYSIPQGREESGHLPLIGPLKQVDRQVLGNALYVLEQNGQLVCDRPEFQKCTLENRYTLPPVPVKVAA